jgi:hypothetical protein
MTINPRKLAAIDMVFLGARVIIAEYAIAVLLCPALGALTLLRAHSWWQLALGLYLISLGMNYVPLLVYAVSLHKKRGALAEIADELKDKRQAMAKYRRQSIFLLVPLLPAIEALRQHRQSGRP